MADTDSVKTKLRTSLNDFCSITKELLEVVSGDAKHSLAGGSDQQALVLTSVLDRLISQDREIQKLTETALEMRSRQQEVERVDTELEKRSQDIRELQTRLQEAEKKLETALYLGNQKLESIGKAKQGAVSPETLIHYTHRISQASSAVSPVGWHANDPRRPYPPDSDMISGLLGRLSSGRSAANPPQAPTNAPSGGGPQKNTISIAAVEAQLPPEKKIALATGIAASKAMPKHPQPPSSMAGGGTFNPFGPGMTFTDPETMSEDSSPSSSDEA